MTSYLFVAPEPPVALPSSEPPSISVVIACYNAADTVAESIASALAQTAPAAEVIVCDDGSTDDIDAALAPFLDRIVLLRRENGGAAAARNTAVRAATSEFVAVLDADDVYEPRRLEALGALAASRPDLDIVTTDAYVERDGTREGRLFELNPFDVVDQRCAILQTSFVGGWPAVRRRRILEVGGYDETLHVGEDWDLWLRLIYTGSAAGTVDEPLMTYRRRSSGLTGNVLAAHRAGIEVLEKNKALPGLTGREHAALEQSIERKRRRLALEEIAAAAAGGSRSALVRTSLQRQVPIRVRLAALKAAVRRSGPTGGDG